MLRRCDGNDPNLIRDAVRGEPMPEKFPWWKNAMLRPCDCGKVFNDVHYSTYYPHHPV